MQAPELHPLPVPGNVGPKTERVHSYIVAMTDYFRKFPFVAPLKHKSAAVFAQLFI